MLPSRRILDDAASSTSCSCAQHHRSGRRRLGCQNRNGHHDHRGQPEHQDQSMGRRNHQWLRDGLWCCRDGYQSHQAWYQHRGRRGVARLVGLGGALHRHRGAVGADRGSGECRPRGDDAHPCPEMRRTDCCPVAAHRGGGGPRPVRDAVSGAGSSPKVWGWLVKLQEWALSAARLAVGSRRLSQPQPQPRPGPGPGRLPWPSAWPEREAQPPRPVVLGPGPGVPQRRPESAGQRLLRPFPLPAPLPQVPGSAREQVVWGQESAQLRPRNAHATDVPPVARWLTRRSVRTHPCR